ncbi:MAG: hypothetical protein IE927_01580 [Rhodobacterales bacterium]|nr:hypothetical protein [Rhodobacterales bacterium]
MCGELDEGVQINAEIRDRLTIIARKVGVQLTGDPVDPGPLAEAPDRAAYMERLFAGILGDTLAEVEGAAETEKIDVIASRAIVLARLAGFLAGQLPPDADLFRAVIEAVTEGHAEPRRIAEKLRAQMQDHHHHHHGHDHDHDHHHDHGHHHGHRHG